MTCMCRSIKSCEYISRSKDVIHSFYLPNLRLRQDAVPGRTILVWFEATKPGKYELPCSQLCGFGHSGMKGWLYVHTPEEYRNGRRKFGRKIAVRHSLLLRIHPSILTEDSER